MVNLSVVIIAKNEEKNIGRCLDSVKEIADDIVVIDSFSTDSTEEICLSYGARFVQNQFKGHIEQKNFAITQAKYPHILSLDADEALDETLKKSIREVKNNWRYDGYYMNRLTNYCGKWIRHCGWYPDKKLRLWDSQKGKWTGINPHDRYELSGGGKTGSLKGQILHYSFYTIEDHLKQINYFTNIAANALFEQGKRPGILNLIISPPFKFFRDYFLKRGFLDGYFGLVVCILSSYATFIKYAKLEAMYRERKG